MKASCEDHYDEAREYRQIEIVSDIWMSLFYLLLTLIGVWLILYGLGIRWP